MLICCHTFDRLHDTEAAVESVLRQTLTAHELIVSVDHNPALADHLDTALPSSVMIVRNEGDRGVSATRNAGVERATGEIVAFLDDDAVAEPDWLALLMEAFEDPDVMVAGGRSIPAWERGSAPGWFPREYEFVVGCTGHTIAAADGEVRNTTGSNMAVRRSVFQQLGGWGVKFGRGQVKTGGDEAELCLRVKSTIPGARVLHVRKAIAHHKVPRERSSLRYVFSYVFEEGSVRAMLEKELAAYTPRPLEGEQVFLRDLVARAIPERLRHIYRPASLAQLAVILACTALVGAGYVRGRLTYR